MSKGNKEYVITNGKKYVKQKPSGQYGYVSNSAISDVWENPGLADAILQNALPKAIRGDFYIAYWDGKEYVKCSMSENEKKERRDKVTVNTEDRYELSLYSFDNDEDVQNIIKGFEAVRDSFYNNRDKYRLLEEKLCRVDFIDEDLIHYLGKKRVNASNGFKMTRSMQQTFLKRRSIKNQMELVKQLNYHFNDVIGHINDICNTIETLRNQTYKPRILADLFKNDNLDVEI